MTEETQKKENLMEQVGQKIDIALDTQLLNARAFPRDIRQVLKNILDTVTLDSDIASGCFYSVPKGGKDPRTGQHNMVNGPSIRLAEICASFWGNMHAGTRFVSNDGKYITVEGWAWDLQNNFKISVEVTKSIRNKSGYVYSPEMQATAQAAAASIALRNAIFKIIPQVFVDKAYKSCMDLVLHGVVQNKEDGNKYIKRLNEMGIETSKILSYFNIETVDLLAPQHIQEIIGIGTSIKDGYLLVEEAFQSINHASKILEEIDHVG